MADFDLKIVSFDGHNINDGTNYEAGFVPAMEWGLPDADPQWVPIDGGWPLIGGLDRKGEEMRFQVRIVGTNKRSLRDQLLRWFDPEDETPKKLIVEDEDGTNDRFKYAVCSSCVPIPVSGVAYRDGYFITLKVHADVRWREVAATTPSAWNITASGQTQGFTNNGTDDCYPIYDIKPTTQKTGEYTYSRFISISWRSPIGASAYPVRIGPFDTTDTNKFKSLDFYDLRVVVDGKEVNRWTYPSQRNANTYVWIQLDFQPMASDTLLTSIPASGGINSIEIGEGIYDFPDEGIVRIDNELFSYTARDLAEERLTGITRAIKNSTMGAHTGGSDIVYWIQHEVELKYGYSGASAPDVDDDWKPDFSLNGAESSNEQWYYTTFGKTPYTENAKRARLARADVWRNDGKIQIPGPGKVRLCYTKTLATLWHDPYYVIGAGVLISNTGYAASWYLPTPCGAVDAKWETGKMWADDKDAFYANIRYQERDTGSWTVQYGVPNPTVSQEFQSWSKDFDGTDWDPVGDVVSMIIRYYDSFVEVDTVTLKFDSTQSPAVMFCTENSDNYPLNAKITNQTTGEVMYVEFTMGTNQTLAVDTDDQYVTYEKDNTRQLQAVSLNTVRKQWLRLQPGSNTLKYEDTNTGNVTLNLAFYERYY